MLGDATSPNTSCEHSTRKPKMVDVFPLYISFGTWKNSDPPPILRNMKHDLPFATFSTYTRACDPLIHFWALSPSEIIELGGGRGGFAIDMRRVKLCAPT